LSQIEAAVGCQLDIDLAALQGDAVHRVVVGRQIQPAPLKPQPLKADEGLLAAGKSGIQTRALQAEPADLAPREVAADLGLRLQAEVGEAKERTFVLPQADL